MSLITAEEWREAATALDYGNVERVIEIAKAAAADAGVEPFLQCDRCGSPILDCAIRWQCGEISEESFAKATINHPDFRNDFCTSECWTGK